jgi:branched-chain amino acid transport system substrate-binding protein
VQAQFFEVCAAAGIRPDFLYNFAWDPGMIAIDAFRTLGIGATAEQVRGYIAGLHGYTGLSGDYDFRDGSQRGLTEQNVMLVRWDADKETWNAVSRPGGQPLR